MILDEKSAATTRPSPSAPDPTSSPTGPRARRSRSTSGDGFRDAGEVKLAHVDLPLHLRSAAQVAAMLAGDVDAIPALRQARRR